MIRGYLRGAASFVLYVDDIEHSAIRGEINSQDPGDSVYAIIWEETHATIGDYDIDLSNYQIFLTAIEPDQRIN